MLHLPIGARQLRGLTFVAALVGAALFFIHWTEFADPAAFGMWHDDTLIFATARSLADGNGYRLPSWPEELPQTKYPPVYPAVLALVLKASPEMPVAVKLGFAMNAGFGIAFIMCCWAWLRGVSVSRRRAALLTAACATHPIVGALSASILSDILFSALMVACAAAADRAVAARGLRRTEWWWAAAVLASFAILTRSLGLAAPVGLAAVAWRARLGKSAWFALVLPLASSAAWSVWTAKVTPMGLQNYAPGYAQTVVFYTSYLGFWARSVPDWEAFVRMLPTNVLTYLQGPVFLGLQIAQVQSKVVFPLAAAISVGMLWAIVRRVWSGSASTLSWMLIPYSGAVLVWNYPLMWRFLLPFLPLFLLELAELTERLVVTSVRAANNRHVALRLLGWTYLIAVAAIALAAAYSYTVTEPRRWRNLAGSRRGPMAAKLEAYDWIKASTIPHTRFIAYEDALLYLHTSRKAARPIALTTRVNYDLRYPVRKAELAFLRDVARQVKADYWVVSTDDYGIEAPRAAEVLLKETTDLVSTDRLVFRSSDGRIQIYKWE